MESTKKLPTEIRSSLPGNVMATDNAAIGQKKIHRKWSTTSLLMRIFAISG